MKRVSAERGTPTPVTAIDRSRSETAHQWPQFLPDGRWFAYVSDESGNPDVYVENFPESRGKLQISIGGGTAPRWRHDGKEIFYFALDGTLMAVPLKGGSDLEPGAPVRLFQTNLYQGYSYDVTADGQRFLIVAPPKNLVASPITVIVNWIEQLKK